MAHQISLSSSSSFSSYSSDEKTGDNNKMHEKKRRSMSFSESDVGRVYKENVQPLTLDDVQKRRYIEFSYSPYEATGEEIGDKKKMRKNKRRSMSFSEGAGIKQSKTRNKLGRAKSDRFVGSRYKKNGRPLTLDDVQKSRYIEFSYSSDEETEDKKKMHEEKRSRRSKSLSEPTVMGQPKSRNKLQRAKSDRLDVGKVYKRNVQHLELADVHRSRHSKFAQTFSPRRLGNVSRKRSTSDKPQLKKGECIHFKIGPMMFVYVLDAHDPVIVFKTWLGRMRRDIVNVTRKDIKELRRVRASSPMSLFYEAIVKKNYSNSLGFSSICKRIDYAIKLLQEISENDYLKLFSRCLNPQTFWNIYHKELNYLEQYHLKCIIGGDRAINLLKNAVGKNGASLRNQNLQLSKDIAYIERGILDLTKGIFAFKRGFDCIFPIFLTKFMDIIDTFRCLKSADFSRKKHFLQLNGQWVFPPKCNKEELGNRHMDFIACLVQQLEGKKKSKNLKKAHSLNLKKIQSLVLENPTDIVRLNKKLFNNAGLQEELREAMKVCSQHVLEQSFELIRVQKGERKKTKCFASKYLEIKEKCHAEDTFFLQTLKQHSDWVWHCLESFSCFQEQNWKEVAETLVTTLYPKILAYDVLKKEIPYLPLLQALSFSVYSQPEQFMRDVILSALFSQVIGEISFKQVPYGSTKFAVIFKSKTGEFTVTQKRKYDLSRICENRERKNLGMANIFWTLYGNLNSRQYHATLQIKLFKFARTTPVGVQKEVVSRFFLDWMEQETRWKHLVEKYEEEET